MMKKTENKTVSAKRRYSRPNVQKVKIDNQISMVMMSEPPGDPESYFPLNPFK